MKWDYDEPSRQEARAELPDEEPTSQRKRKNTRKWCRGKEGVEHDKQIRLGKSAERRVQNGHPPCITVSWKRRYAKWWSCGHEEYCDQCGKIFRWYLPPDECPHYDNRVEKGN